MLKVVLLLAMTAYVVTTFSITGAAIWANRAGDSGRAQTLRARRFALRLGAGLLLGLGVPILLLVVAAR